MLYLVIFYIVSVIICRELNIKTIKMDRNNPNVWIICLIPILNFFMSIPLIFIVGYLYIDKYKGDSAFKIIKGFRGDYRIK